MALKAKKKAGTRGKTPAPAGKKSTSVSRALTPFEEMDVLFDRLSRGLMSVSYTHLTLPTSDLV